MPHPLAQKGKERREELMGFLRSYRAEHGYAPSLMEIADAMGISSTNAVRQHLRQLEVEGRITMQPRIPRSIVIRDGERA